MTCFSVLFRVLFFNAAVLAESSKPNILFLLADDMGWANIGYHRRNAMTADEKQGQLEVQTPAMDSLADEGIILDRHYAYRICGPARSSLLSGRLGSHVLAKNVAVTAQNKKDPVSGFAGIPRNITGMGTKVKEGGYKTYYVGKWDAGMATPHHTPRGRGFDESFMYFQHANDYWNKKTGLQATGEITTCLNSFYDLMIENDTYRGPYRGAALTDACKNSEERTPYCYEEKMFEERSLDIISNHNASDEEHPLFLFHAFHLLHSPLQIPNYYYKMINTTVVEQGGPEFDSNNRRLLMAMTKYLDDTVKNLTEALKTKGMWDNTLVVFTTDNGGPIYEPGSANNYPLRGGKYSDFEGGVRTNTWISGGFIPKESRGRIHNGIVSISDWYYIFSELAGVDPHDKEAEAANVWLKKQGLDTLRPIDGKPGMLQSIFEGSPGPRGNESLYLSSTAILEYPYKLVTGKQPYMAHTGPLYPNCTTVSMFESGYGPDFVDASILELKVAVDDEKAWRGDCSDGCLFNLEVDPSESHDLSKDPSQKERLARMIQTLAEFNKTLFVPERGETHLDTCFSMMFNGGGHFGPFVDIEDYFTEAPRTVDDLDEHEKIQMAAMTATTLKPVRKAAQELGSKFALKWLEISGDKCCMTHECVNGPSAAPENLLKAFKQLDAQQNRQEDVEELMI
eukprot:CAMPEP_0197639640 /NCGR_PEP_ID=MMETSP1338-20131121/14202_1 /TAXON_ID=43686 ORGANISM="Pelagodinium beii, Strain RCC1491" /NCGR_SAMPLE_ID=MMETSP1338 /ASSEMBLY_ACC=CAM_ASM_000754 /LENGTH=679 /DNA_ID=CAMNT_0043212397 /DNA_START=62 /DNA_END=2101 /DNA_ORIENTATION=-